MKLTIFTPTYNRALLLTRLYDSLKGQVYKDFEWIIVDDGSNDNTEQLIKSFVSEGKLDITYHKQNNAGKHVAINKGADLAKGELFFIVDSDDFLPIDSLSLIVEQYLNIRDQPNIAGVVGKRKLIGKTHKSVKLKEKSFLCSLYDFRFKYHYEGDMAEVIRTEVIMKYPFPSFPSEKFCTEALVWNRISKDYVFLYFDQFIYDCEYQDDGLTSKYWQLMLNNPQGSLLYYKELLSFPMSKKDRKQTLKAYNNIAKVRGDSKTKVLKEVGLKDFLRIYLP